jgi:hypothetical protein
MGVSLFQELYSKQLWDPRHAALVNGRPVLREEVEEVLKAGLYPPLTAEGGEPGTITMRQILDKLIEEELVLQAAERAGLTVTDEEVGRFLEGHMLAWGCGEDARQGYLCRLPRGEELESLAASLRERLLLQKAVAYAAGRLGRRAARDWERFLAEWVQAHTVPRVYEVRALLSEKSPAALGILRSAKARAGGLGGLVDNLKAAGAGCIVSDPIYLDPGKAAVALAGAGDLGKALAAAAGDSQKLTAPFELAESYAVLEILKEVPPPTPEQIIQAARAGYEGRVADEAFRAFVRDLYKEAEIVINPNFPGSAPAGRGLQLPSASRGHPEGAPGALPPTEAPAAGAGEGAGEERVGPPAGEDQASRGARAEGAAGDPPGGAPGGSGKPGPADASGTAIGRAGGSGDGRALPGRIPGRASGWAVGAEDAPVPPPAAGGGAREPRPATRPSPGETVIRDGAQKDRGGL